MPKKLKLKEPKGHETRQDHYNKKDKSRYYTETNPIEDYEFHINEKLREEREWQAHLMDTLGEEEPDFWYHRFEQPTFSQTKKDKLMEMDEEEYRRYILNGIYERKGYKKNYKPYFDDKYQSEKDKGKKKDKKKKDKEAKEEEKESNIKQRLYYFKEWEEIFKSKSNFDYKMFRLSDIPWPFNKDLCTKIITLDENNLDLNSIITKQVIKKFLNIQFDNNKDQNKKMLKRELLRYHPDKFTNFNIVPKPVDFINLDNIVLKHAKLTLLIVNHLSMIFQELWSEI